MNFIADKSLISYSLSNTNFKFMDTDFALDNL